jgi:hypothetical protein
MKLQRLDLATVGYPAKPTFVWRLSVKEGDIVRVVKKDGETQSYVPWGHVCELVKGFQEYAVILYKGNEYLMSKKVLEAVSENG